MKFLLVRRISDGFYLDRYGYFRKYTKTLPCIFYKAIHAKSFVKSLQLNLDECEIVKMEAVERK